MNILCYTYEANYHCIECTQKRFSNNGKVYGTENDIAQLKPCTDRNGIWFETIDIDGNFVHPVFTTDEWQELDEDFVSENPIQYLVCGSCQVIVDTYPYSKNNQKAMFQII